MYVKFKSTYCETDRYGNSRSFTNSFEAEGTKKELYSLFDKLLSNKALPGTTPLNSLNTINKYLLEE